MAITFHLQLCSASYTALKMNNSIRSISAINPVAAENVGNKHDQHSHRQTVSHYHESTPCIACEKNWDTKEDKDKSMMCVL